MKHLKITAVLCIGILCGCNYLDIVPDNIATIDYAFRMRNEAEKYLFTCYSYMPAQSSPSANPAFTAGDEFWFSYPFLGFSAPAWNIARGNQNIVDPYANFWDGAQAGTPLFKGIRDCNIFLENIDTVPDMEEVEKARWAAEVKFLKAYYDFWLVRMYGPIPLIKENLPVSSSPEAVKLWREPVDTCFSYIVSLIDEAVPFLPERLEDETSELGRITQPIALALKARVLATEASPLFNGNPDYANVTDSRGMHLFSQESDADKWKKAAEACKAAIDLCHAIGYKLYRYQQDIATYDLSDSTVTKMSIRNSICEKWNSEIIWGNTNSMGNSIQREATPTGLDPSNPANQNTHGNLGVTLKIAELFYTRNGVPITEDKTWDYSGRLNLKMATAADKYNIAEGYTTAALNFDREPRFYADLGFDGGIWYGQGRYDDKDTWHLEAKSGQSSAPITNTRYNITGYWPKKLVHYQNVIGTGNTYTVQQYPWPVIRLADLYLLYAEALNEEDGPGTAAYRWIDSVRSRAGLRPVAESWTNFSTNPGKYQTKEGLRAIIHQERLIELAFEGQRYWDLRRWKEALSVMNSPVRGWDINQEADAAYYRERVLFDQVFKTRDYLWPIKQQDIIVNKELVQNPGW
ncbi:RagB/SusD family nutrient uptake outer membrane protein [Compostibacter hankyongensis]|uniref:RagB/SusD family nutrient uptake outer membrane protein n=1 Tax=Compostibacter hankyongensis TaxID=1007089 RepID=A0ABP8FVH6_9BACT